MSVLNLLTSILLMWIILSLAMMLWPSDKTSFHSDGSSESRNVMKLLRSEEVLGDNTNDWITGKTIPLDEQTVRVYKEYIEVIDKRRFYFSKMEDFGELSRAEQYYILDLYKNTYYLSVLAQDINFSFGSSGRNGKTISFAEYCWMYACEKVAGLEIESFRNLQPQSFFVNNIFSSDPGNFATPLAIIIKKRWANPDLERCINTIMSHIYANGQYWIWSVGGLDDLIYINGVFMARANNAIISDPVQWHQIIPVIDYAEAREIMLGGDLNRSNRFFTSRRFANRWLGNYIPMNRWGALSFADLDFTKLDESTQSLALNELLGVECKINDYGMTLTFKNSYTLSLPAVYAQRSLNGRKSDRITRANINDKLHLHQKDLFTRRSIVWEIIPQTKPVMLEYDAATRLMKITMSGRVIVNRHS